MQQSLLIQIPSFSQIKLKTIFLYRQRVEDREMYSAGNGLFWEHLFRKTRKSGQWSMQIKYHCKRFYLETDRVYFGNT